MLTKHLINHSILYCTVIKHLQQPFPFPTPSTCFGTERQQNKSKCFGTDFKWIRMKLIQHITNDTLRHQSVMDRWINKKITLLTVCKN